MTTLGKRLAPPRFILFIGLLLAAVPAGIALAGWSHGLLAGFDLAAGLFLLTLVPLFRDRGADAMRDRARENDANRTLLLVVTFVVTVAVLAAITAELGQKQAPEPLAVALIIGSLVLSWLFSNAVYTLHYADMFYRQQEEEGGDEGGLDFPACDEPDYWDFAYFAFTLGMTFQTSDVDITARGVRRVALFHSLAAFIFNIGVLAFTINALGG